jgi:drug/metabolite transporter superfamily protein YnfA
MRDFWVNFSHARGLFSPMIIFGGVFFVAAMVYLWKRLGRRIYSRETLLTMSTPFPLVGRPDLIMQEWGGSLVIHDLKRRKSPKLYPADQLQLSLYALLVRRSTGRSVANYGYIRLLAGDKTLLSRVELMRDDQRLLDLYAAFQTKADYPASALPNGPAYLCRGCGFKGRQCRGNDSGGRPRRAI